MCEHSGRVTGNTEVSWNRVEMSVLPTIRTFPAHRATLISMRALMNFKEREGWSLHIV